LLHRSFAVYLRYLLIFSAITPSAYYFLQNLMYLSLNKVEKTV